MNEAQKEKFLARGEQLGHSRTHLQNYGMQTTYVTLHSIEDVRRIVRSLDPQEIEQREEHIRQLAASRTASLQDSLESFLYGTGDLTSKQLREAEKGLPQTFQITSMVDYTMPHGQTVVGPSGQPTIWNYGTLRFYSDSYLTVQNTIFNLTVQNLIMQYSEA